MIGSKKRKPFIYRYLRRTGIVYISKLSFKHNMGNYKLTCDPI